MPTTITSAGVTFNDTTSLTSANIGTAQLVNGSVIASKLGTNEQKQIAKAWVNFNGTTSPGTIRSSYNVSSVTKNAVGDYTVNFASAMADANYSVSSKTNFFGTAGAIPVYESIYIVSASSIRITCGQYGGSTLRNATTLGVDTDIISVTIFGN